MRNGGKANIPGKIPSKATRASVVNVNKPEIPKPTVVSGAKSKGKQPKRTAKIVADQAKQTANKGDKISTPAKRKIATNDKSDTKGKKVTDAQTRSEPKSKRISTCTPGKFQQHASLTEEGQIINMSVEADEENLQNDSDSDSEIEMDIEAHGSQDQQSGTDYDSDQSNDTTDSVKIRPIMQEERLKQLEVIDEEMTDRLKHLHDIMAEGGLKQSSAFLQQHFGVNQSASPKIKTKKADAG